MWRDRRFQRVRQHGNPVLRVDGRRRLRQRQPLWDRLSHPQRQHVPLGARHFYTWYDVKGVKVALLVCPQASLNPVVVGDGDHVQLAVFGGEIQHLARGRDAVAQRGMHV